MTHREIHPFNKSSIESSCQTQSLQGGLQSGACSKAHHVRHTNQLAPLVAFLHLAVDQARCHLPLAHFPPSPLHLPPLTKVSRERIEVEIKLITGKEREATRNQGLAQGVQKQ